MKTKGEMESEISEAIVQFEIDYMGRGTKEARTHIIEDIVFVRLKGVLTKAEEQAGLFFTRRLLSTAG